MSAVATRPHPRPAKTNSKPRALVLRAPGTNCDRETVLALELAGARPEAIHVEQFLAGQRGLDDFGIVVLPGGFSFGDHLGAGTLWAHRLDALAAPLARFVAAGRPVLGICNGFQALLKLGLLEGGALAPNASGRFECRWVWLRRADGAMSPLLDGVDLIALPVAHGEGRFVADVTPPSPIALHYCDAQGNPGPYPINPNGSDADIAALTNAAGNVLGLMPHPERDVLPGQAPAGRPDGAGLRIFQNAVRLARG